MSDACFKSIILSIVQPIDMTSLRVHIFQKSRHLFQSNYSLLCNNSAWEVFVGQQCHIHLYQLHVLLHNSDRSQGMLCPNYHCLSLHILEDHCHQSRTHLKYSHHHQCFKARYLFFKICLQFELINQPLPIRSFNSMCSSASKKGSESSSIPQLTIANSPSKIPAFFMVSAFT